VVVSVLIAISAAIPVTGPLAGVGIALGMSASFLLPITLGVAILRRDDVVLPRVLVFVLLSTILLAAYLGIVGLSDLIFGADVDRVVIVVAAGVIAVLLAPLRSWLQAAVDRLVYGDSGNPYEALTELGRRVSGSPDDVLGEVVRTVADAVRAGYVAITLAGDDEPAAAVGVGPASGYEVPLTFGGTEVGRLEVSSPGRSDPLSARERQLVQELAGHIGVTAHAAVLARDLQRSRESLVLAREEERRRIRRDLHDGLGPALAGVAFGIDAARNNLVHDPSAASAALQDLKAEVQSSISDVRRLVYDLRPPVLDQLGLVPAVEAYAARLSEGGGFSVQVQASELPPLPAAVEVAAYRIATEALTNVVRHAGARHACVSFEASGSELRVDVADDGRGISGEDRVNGRSSGVGLSAMKERAAELGGQVTWAGRPGSGTTVVASLPLETS
jgi:signal transduction histidine kinase